MGIKETMVVGKISSAHGIKGEILVFPLTDDVARFLDMTYFICETKNFTIEEVRIHKGQALIKTTEITDRTSAEHMKGKLVEVLREDAVELEKGEYFIEDLKGIAVRDLDGSEVGTLKDVMQTGATDIFYLEIGGKDMMMPFLKEYVAEINMEDGFVRLDVTKCIS
jgi:16S rRNA processing protein RimM